MPYATVEEALYARMSANSALNTAVGGRIYPVLNTQEPTFPQVVYTKLGGSGGTRLSGGSNSLKRYVVRVDVFAATEAEADAVGKKVRDAITPDGSPWRDVTNGVQGAFHEDTTADFTEDGLRLQSETFGVWFVPT